MLCPLSHLRETSFRVSPCNSLSDDFRSTPLPPIAWVELGNSEESSVGLLDELKAIESFKASADKAVAVHDATGKPELRGTNGVRFLTCITIELH